MNRNVFRGLLSDFKHRVSGNLADELRRHQDWLIKMPLPIFQQFIGGQWKMAIKYVKQSCSENFPGEFALAYLAADLNGVLPLNYPYIVTLVTLKDTPEKVFVSATYRKMIPGLHECLRARYVPVCCAENKEAFLSMKIERTWEFEFREALRNYLQKSAP